MNQSNPSSESKATPIGWLLAIVGLILLADQVTKALVSNALSLGESVPVFSGWLHFTLVQNSGMAFGLLSGTDIPFKAALVTIVSLAAITAVGLYAWRTKPEEKWTRYGLMLVLGGACGNILDRIRLGYVVDFVDVFYGTTHWPAFNVADASICVGVGLLLLDSLHHRDAASSDAPVSVPAPATHTNQQPQKGDS